MKLSKWIMLPIIWISFLACAHATDSLEQARKKAYQGFLEGNIALSQEALTLYEQAYRADPENEHLAVQWMTAWHGHLGLMLDPAQDTDAGEKQLKAYEKELESLLKRYPEQATFHALYGSMLGMKISLSPMKGMMLGGKSQKHLARAIEIAPDLPIAWLMEANNKYHTPAMFGGDMEAAVIAYERTITLIESQPDTRFQNSTYLQAHAWLGLAQAELGNPHSARATFEKILKFEPGFYWVQYTLLPQLSE